ncbi:GGDEF domain-containing protein [Prauserella halophila]|uniref:GGDEF domain-containing protein n=1 Tax=Prauserella halophila TaxID=185641 RepID=A0ABN1W4L7_9PSEU|nr:diguanylate cyclase (GGDEF) domain-containing protein [Prauserella halophila]
MCPLDGEESKVAAEPDVAPGGVAAERGAGSSTAAAGAGFPADSSTPAAGTTPQDPAPALGDKTDAWLLGRARELIALVQRSEKHEQQEIITRVDKLLHETQRRGEPLIVAQMLRAAALSRLISASAADQAGRQLDEMLAHTSRHGATLLRADAHALRGRRLVLAGHDDAALTEIARALALLDDPPSQELGLGRRAWDRLLSTALNDCWIVLNQLGVYEVAEEVITRAHQAVRDSAGPHEITMLLMNRVKMLLGWGLRLERVGRSDEAGERFRTAASMAIAVEAPFAESLFPRHAGVAAVDQVASLASALALAAPSDAHIDRLRSLRATPVYPYDNPLLAIALARCLESIGEHDEAFRLLMEDRHHIPEEYPQPSMRIGLIHELARFADRYDIGEPRAQLADYAGALEAELWSMRESQSAALDTRREHERLSAAHGAITQQALQDPLTGLPNRRALDRRLHGFATSTATEPLAVALIDLDGFKGVNDQRSHADGDDVLRVVASTLRDSLRGDDIVARYGGDEFVALLPGATLAAAQQAMNRAVAAVDELPRHLSHGVTLSVGLVALRAGERGEEVLSRADAAMYQAKRRGGNQVAACVQPDGETETATGDGPTSGAGEPT